MLRTQSREANTILFVDDEPHACKSFARTFCGEFTILTAPGVDEALTLLRERANEVAVVVTDFRMPRRDGLDLLRAVQREFRHLVHLLATAHIDKDVAIAAVNEGKVLRILGKPLDEEATKEALREALTLYRAQALERSLNEGRVAATRETLGFLAHELNTPLATTRAVLSGPWPTATSRPHRVRRRVPCSSSRSGRARSWRRSKRQSAVRSIASRWCPPSCSPRATPTATLPYSSVSAAKLVRALLDEFPFEEDEASWVRCDVARDFTLPCRRDLLYLVMCTLTKNALQALRGRAAPALCIEVGATGSVPGLARSWMRFVDNGPGIAPEILARLTREPVTTRSESGGNGMGLMFCQRVMQSIGGSIEIESELGRGAAMTLYFHPTTTQATLEARARQS